MNPHNPDFEYPVSATYRIPSNFMEALAYWLAVRTLSVEWRIKHDWRLIADGGSITACPPNDWLKRLMRFFG